MRRTALAALAIVLAVGVTPAIAATPPQVSISDIEDEVMCPVCGTLLELADSPQARREKDFVAEMIEAGRTKEEIKDALVAQYGRDVLALPEGSGFDLSAYLVPAIAFVLALVGLALAVWRWRGRGGTGRPSSTPPDPGESERLDADIARYDL